MAAKKRETKAGGKGTAKGTSTKNAKRKALKLRSASPSLTVNDVEKSLAWYRDVLGFTPGERWESDGQLLGVELAAGDVTFMIGQDDWKKGRDRVKGLGLRIHCETKQDIDSLAANIIARAQPWCRSRKTSPGGCATSPWRIPTGF